MADVLNALSYRELQALAKQHGVAANTKTEVMVSALLAKKATPERAAPEPSTKELKTTPTKAGSDSSRPSAGTTEVKRKTASRLTEQLVEPISMDLSEPGKLTPAKKASDEAAAIPVKKEPVLGKASRTGSVGYAEIHSVRLGTKGPFPGGSRLWGAQTWQTKKADGQAKKTDQQLSVRLKRMDRGNGVADTLIVDRNNEPLQVKGAGGADVDFRFSLARLSTLDIQNGVCKLEFLRPAEDRYAQPPGGPLVVLTFHEKGVLTVEQFAFLAELTRKVEKLGQNSAEGVKLGLQKEVDWLPQRYTQGARHWLRLVLTALALAATLPPTRKVLRWCTSPPLAAFADALHEGALAFLCELANWLFVGLGLLRTLMHGLQNFLSSGTEAAAEVGVNLTFGEYDVIGGASRECKAGSASSSAAQKKKN